MCQVSRLRMACRLKHDALEDPPVRARTSILADHDPTDMVLYAYTFAGYYAENVFASWPELDFASRPQCEAVRGV